VRAAAARGLAWIGVRMDENRNANVDADAEITGEKAQVRTFVVTAREDLQIARETRQLIADPKGVR
jgi:acetate kinase